MAEKYYAVKKGHKTGIFEDWASCSKQVHGYKGAMYKKFEDRKLAEAYLATNEALTSERHNSEEEILEGLKDGEAIAYVDGSNLGDGSAFSWGVILFDKKKGKVEISGKSEEERFTKYRNISGELFASVNAVNYAVKNNLNKIIIYHDYSGIRHWALGEWKTKNDLSKVYRNFFEKAMKVIKVEFVKADGHTGDKFNEEADVLAKRELGIK